MNPPDNRASRILVFSYGRSNPVGLPYANPHAYDDFTSAVATTIRTVSWQGGYCRNPPPGSGPMPPPAPVVRSFQVAFYPDNNGRPAEYGYPLYEATFTPAEAHEQLTFDSGPGTSGCDWWAPTASYYDYTAVLPMPFPVTAGTRYWLLMRADTGNTGPWGWRIGMQDNNYSMSYTRSAAEFRNPDLYDLAFSLSSQ